MLFKRKYYFSILLVFCIIAACSKKDTPGPDRLVLISEHILTIPETSGLSFYDDPDRFLTVSDSLSRVYIITASGMTLDSLAYEGKNLEGVTYDHDNRRVFVAEENSNEVVVLDTAGIEISRFAIHVGNPVKNQGLEGITFNPSNGHLYIVSEKFPGRLYETTIEGNIIDSADLSFAKDYSALFFEPASAKLWVLSDESESLTRCSMSGVPERRWNTGVKDAEGVVVDGFAKRIYIVTDKDNRLLEFNLPQN